ncbi:hypothetical protein pb186bvf_017400 [Paramecium bursaria]
MGTICSPSKQVQFVEQDFQIHEQNNVIFQQDDIFDEQQIVEQNIEIIDESIQVNPFNLPSNNQTSESSIEWIQEYDNDTNEIKGIVQ